MKNSIIAVMAIALLASFGFIVKEKATQNNNLSLEEAKTKMIEFVNKNLVPEGTNATIKEATEEGGLYKLVISLGDNQDVTSYVTKDGKKFFPQVFDVAEIEKQSSEQASQSNQEEINKNTPKSETPEVELFVMSHCPYGTQIEKGILPVLETLGEKINFSLKFCNYAMHGKEELDEQARQYCIQKNEPENILTYLSCFLKEGKSANCLGETGIDTNTLSKCVSETDNEFKITSGFNDKSTWSGGKFPLFKVFQEDNEKYNVQGSPTLVINGSTVQSSRDSASLLSAICAGFEEQPEECSTELSSETPSSGFGFEGSGTDNNASCN